MDFKPACLNTGLQAEVNEIGLQLRELYEIGLELKEDLCYGLATQGGCLYFFYNNNRIYKLAIVKTNDLSKKNKYVSVI